MKTQKKATIATVSLRQKCIKCNVDYEKARKYKYRHPELTDEQVINYYMQKEKSFRQKCIDYNVNYNTAKTFRKNHPELSDEQVIIAYRPDLRLNIFGEIILPD